MSDDEIIRNYDLMLIDNRNLNNLLNEREWFEASKYCKRILATIDLFKKSSYQSINRALDSVLEE